MRARGHLEFDDGVGDPEWGKLDVEVANQRVRATIGPTHATGLTVESTDRRVLHHYSELDRARRAAEYRNAAPPPPRFKTGAGDKPKEILRQMIADGLETLIPCPGCQGSGAAACAICFGEGMVTPKAALSWYEEAPPADDEILDAG